MRTVSLLTPFLLLMTSLLAACQATTEPAVDTVAAKSVLSGEVWYRQRSALPPDAVLEVSLLDVSRADAQATVLAHQKVEPAGQVPIRFALAYEATQIKPNMSYAVQATIRQGNKLLFINTERFAVLTRGAPTDQVKVRVDPV